MEAELSVLNGLGKESTEALIEKLNRTMLDLQMKVQAVKFNQYPDNYYNFDLDY
jgi:hypothetical protein